MKAKLKLMRAFLTAGGFLLAIAPATALAHDNLGGDELSIVNWVVVSAVVTTAMGLLAGLWAYKAGQFNNIEDSKYTMLDLSDDYDAVMEEAERQEKAAKEAASRAAEVKAAVPSSETPVQAKGHADSAAHV